MKRLMTLVLGALLIIACTPSKTTEQTEYSGYLKDYSKLQSTSSPSGAPTLRWISPQIREGNYDKLLIEKITFFPKPEPNPQVSLKTLDEIASYIDSEARKVLAQHYTLVDKPGPNTLRIRSAITGVKRSERGLSAWEILPIGLVVAAASTASDTRDEDVAIFTEAEISDSQTGEVLGIAVRKGFGNRLNNGSEPLQLRHVRPLIDGWMQDFAAVMAQSGVK